MKNKFLALGSLFFVFACAGFQYKFYGVNTNNVDPETLKEIKLIAGQATDKNLTMVSCIPNREAKTPTCIMVPVDEFRLMRQEIVDCRTEKK